MTFSKIIDISMAIREKMTVYRGDPAPQMEWAKKMPVHSSNVTKLTFGAHTGTHVDAPMHFNLQAKRLDELPLGLFVGEALVVDACHEKEKVTSQTLKKEKIKTGDIVLLKTKNSEDEVFRENFIYLDSEAALWLAKKRVKSVGIDGLSVDRYHSGNHPTHHILLDHEVAIVEGLRLKETKAGRYFFICLPLKLVGTEAAPARAILLE